MLEEGGGAMEKKVSARQSQGQCKTTGSTGERKSDSAIKHGYSRRSSSSGPKAQDVVQAPRPIPIQKWDRQSGDKRQRQRFCYDNRQREKIEENDIFDVVSTGSRKGNANHLLNFKFYPYHRHADEHRWYNPNRHGSQTRGGYRKATRYKKEQFLQASCQFVVQDAGDYTEQAINPDALVDWNMVELVRSYSTEPVTCPICLQIPSAGKITKCGHTFCWACILHYIKLGEKDIRKCPICYESIDLDDLKSVQWVDVPDYKIGDEIEMKLMRKTKGSTYAVPKDQWEDRQGKPMNIHEGDNTRYMKLVVASCAQIKEDVLDRERSTLTAQMVDAEESETPFIQMAMEYLKARELALEQIFHQTCLRKGKVYIPGLGHGKVCKGADKSMKEKEAIPDTFKQDIPVYTDAFEEDLEPHHFENQDVNTAVGETFSAAAAAACDGNESHPNDGDGGMPFGSPPCPFPLMQDQEVTPVTLSLEETAEHLELPMDVPQAENQPTRKTHSLNSKDDYFFYQTSTGQHIYLNSLNAQCLAREYGSLEDGPDKIKGTVVAIDRLFMTEDVRKRLRYLGHIPLTCEFHVVELKLKPPLVSKGTLKFFDAAFEKRRRIRQQKAREDKKRSKNIEMEQRKSYGLYPEMQIPLDNLQQFPTPLFASTSLEEESVDENFPVVSLSPTEAVLNGVHQVPVTRARARNDSTSDESSCGSMSFAQMLKASKTAPQPGGAWGRTNLASSPPAVLGPSWPAKSRARQVDNDSDGGESCPAPSYSESVSDAIAKALDGMSLNSSSDGSQPTAGKGRKKRKEKKVLFSTTMARQY